MFPIIPIIVGRVSLLEGLLVNTNDIFVFLDVKSMLCSLLVSIFLVSGEETLLFWTIFIKKGHMVTYDEY